MSYDALIFDLDNTLVDRDAAAGKMYRQWLAKNRPRQTRLLRELIAKDDHGYANPKAFMAWFRSTFKLEMADQEFFDSIRPLLLKELEPYPGVKDILRELDGEYRMAVLTNGHAVGQREKLKVTGLDSLFEPENIFVTGEIGVHKPDAGAFTTVLQHLELPPHRVLMIGDNPRHDIAGAGALGMDTCWISHGRWWPFAAAPTHTIRKVTDLDAFLI